MTAQIRRNPKKCFQEATCWALWPVTFVGVYSFACMSLLLAMMITLLLGEFVQLSQCFVRPLKMRLHFHLPEMCSHSPVRCYGIVPVLVDLLFRLFESLEDRAALVCHRLNVFHEDSRRNPLTEK